MQPRRLGGNFTPRIESDYEAFPDSESQMLSRNDFANVYTNPCLRMGSFNAKFAAQSSMLASQISLLLKFPFHFYHGFALSPHG